MTKDASVGVEEGSLTLESMLRAARLDWKVELEPVQYVSQPGSAPEAVPDAQFVVRVENDGTRSHLATVGSRFTPVQNEEVGRLALDLLQSDDVEFETAGSLKGGRQIWFLARLSGGVALDGRPVDRFDKYLLLLNGHDGSMAQIFKFTTVRVVCSNTKIAALRGEGASFRVKHTKSILSTGLIVERALSGANEAFAAHLEFARRARRAQWADAQLHNMTLALVVPDIFDAEVGSRLTKAKNSLTSAAHSAVARGAGSADARESALMAAARVHVAMGLDFEVSAEEAASQSKERMNFILDAAAEERRVQSQWPDGDRKPGSKVRFSAWDWYNAVTGAATHYRQTDKDAEARMQIALGSGAQTIATAEKMLAVAGA
jgi:phage/plasmid-like protein (TIGR03299 family)